MRGGPGPRDRAGVISAVECQLPKLDVADSIPVACSKRSLGCGAASRRIELDGKTWMGVLTRRPATLSDSTFAKVAHHRAYRDVVIAQFGPWDEAEQDRLFDEAWKENPHEILVCDGAACGYLGVDLHPEEIVLREVVIMPEFQGHGLGSMLLAELRTLSKSRGVPVRLQVLRLNRAANLYRRFGFRECGSTLTHLLMEFTPTADC
jgi:ribosomal protein S18 acetylase RimI-like enzyme